MVRGKLLSVLLAAGGKATSVNLVDRLLAVEQSGSLFQTKSLGFDDKEITEECLEGEPAAVDNL